MLIQKRLVEKKNNSFSFVYLNFKQLQFKNKIKMYANDIFLS